VVAPTFVSDEELTSHPVVVVARWNKTPLVPHHEPIEHARERNTPWQYEVRAAVSVERIVAGEMQFGEHTVLLAEYMVGWREDGWLANWCSIMMAGDVRDVREPNLWFLVPKRSWEAEDPQTYLALQTYRGVQPLKLEVYFQALRSPHSRDAVPRLLGDPDPDMVLRALEYVAGRYVPGTYIDGEYGGGGLWLDTPSSDWSVDWDYYGVPRPDLCGRRIHPPWTFPWARSGGPPLVEQEAAVWGLLKHPNADIRRRAADVYGDLAGERVVSQAHCTVRHKLRQFSGLEPSAPKSRR